MKNYFITLLATVGVIASASAQQWSTTSLSPTTTATNIVLTGAYTISKVTTVAGTNATTLTFYNTASTNLTSTNAAYVSYVTIATNITSVITNSQNLLQTNYYPGQWTYAVTNAATTNVVPVMYAVSVPANSTQIDITALNTVRGLAVTASANGATVSIQYKKSF